jgi:hypothetical protein
VIKPSSCIEIDKNKEVLMMSTYQKTNTSSFENTEIMNQAKDMDKVFYILVVAIIKREGKEIEVDLPMSSVQAD